MMYECKHEPEHLVHLHHEGEVVAPSDVWPYNTDDLRWDCDPECKDEGLMPKDYVHG